MLRHPLANGLPALTRLLRQFAATALMLFSGASHADTVDARCDIYPKGSDKATKVVACTFSQRQGHVAIDRADGVRHELQPHGAAGNYIDEQARPAIRSKGLGKSGQIYRMAHETVFVYWDTSGVPGSAQEPPPGGTPTLLPAAAAPPKPFDQTFKLQGVGFRVTSANVGSINELKIVTSGLSANKVPIVRTIDGQVIRAEVADIDADGSPEIYVYITSAGSGSYGSLVAYSANKRKSLSEIHLPPVSDSATAARGYMGHDEFAVVEGTFVRRFPIYKDGDTNATPSGGVRQLQYKLNAGEAGWVLKLDWMVDY